MQSAEYNNAPSRKNNQQSQNNINFYDMNLKLRSLGSLPLPPSPTHQPKHPKVHPLVKII